MIINNFHSNSEFIHHHLQLLEELVMRSDQQLHIALSGGNTPKPLFQAISQNDLFFQDHIHYWQVDERYVPHDHPDSNYKMIKENLFQNREITNFHAFDTALPIETALEQYANNLPEQFDLTFLGLGSDGHTASLFPHDPALSITNSPVAHTTTSQFAVPDRLTLTFPPILNSQKLIVLLSGRAKKEILEKIQSSVTIDELPAKKLLEHPGLTINFLQ